MLTENRFVILRLEKEKKTTTENRGDDVRRWCIFAILYPNVSPQVETSHKEINRRKKTPFHYIIKQRRAIRLYLPDLL